jgi:integrase/recombinase XerD
MGLSSRMENTSHSLSHAIQLHLLCLEARGFSKATLDTRRWSLNRFASWASDNGAITLESITHALIGQYQAYLAQWTKPNGDRLSPMTQRLRLYALRMFGRWLLQEHLVSESPVLEMILPKVGHSLPKAWLSSSEAEAVLCRPKLDYSRRPAVSLRDKAILETFYSSGIRRTELAKLCYADLNYTNGTVLIRHGKGNRDRVIPIGSRALLWIERYMRDSRPSLCVEGSDSDPMHGPLFLSERGGPISGSSLTKLASRHVRAAGVSRVGSCHIFRHTCATLMLEHGADIRYVQEQLGHASLQTTQIYAHVSVRRLKEVHTATHPGAYTTG